MLAVGSIALGYLTGKAVSKVLKVKLNLPFIFLFSLLPDIDLLIPGLRHRGPTHSLFSTLGLLAFLMILFRKRGIPYSAAYLQHILGDYVTGGLGIQILWPLTYEYFNLKLPSSYFELLIFVASFLFMFMLGDLKRLFEPHPSNFVLIASVIGICSPLFLGFPVPVPNILILPHLIYLFLFLAIILKDAGHHIRKTFA